MFPLWLQISGLVSGFRSQGSGLRVPKFGLIRILSSLGADFGIVGTLMKAFLGLVVVVVGLGLPSCKSVPAMVKTSRGEVFRGTGTTTAIGGTFSLHGSQGLTLRGTTRTWQDSTVFKFDISDGRLGTVPVKSLGEQGGYGVGKLSNGGRCRFMYGKAAISKYGRSGI